MTDGKSNPEDPKLIAEWYLKDRPKELLPALFDVCLVVDRAAVHLFFKP